MKYFCINRILGITFVLLNLYGPVFAQSSNDQHSEAIDKSLELLEAGYVFPEVAEKMSDYVRQRQDAGFYDGLSDINFAHTFTEDLRTISNDLHLNVFIPKLQLSASTQAPRPSRNLPPFVTSTVLDGNLGYIHISQFVGPNQLEDDLLSAMQLVSTTDALIIDLRENRGGSPASIMLLAGYLIPEPTLVSEIYSRANNSRFEMWTTKVEGPHYLGKVYVLTSKNTFSAAEGFSYHLKHLGRITTVGKSTGGGAHRISSNRLPHGFVITIPGTRPINVVTKSDWEGVGVLPDIDVSAEGALQAAQADALKFISSTPK